MKMITVSYIPSAVTLTDVAPTNQDFGDVAAVGAGNQAARDDHLHGMMAAPAGGSDISARAYHSITQSIANATDVILNLNSERWDTDDIHDNVTNNSRLTCKTAGVYIITANVGFLANSTGIRLFSIRLNGTTDLGWSFVDTNQNSDQIVSVATVYELAVNDYIEIKVHQTSGGALATVASAEKTVELSMAKILG